MIMVAGVQIRIVEADIRHYATDLVVLKYAQALHGADRQVVTDSGIDHRTLPAPGAQLAVSAPRNLSAGYLVLLGVPDLSQFTYRHVREFGRRAVAAARLPERVRDLAITLHGVGFGLDEQEVFDSELAGLLDALRSEPVPPSLARVTVVEHSAARAERMRDYLRQLSPAPEGGAIRGPGGATPEPASSEHLRSVGYDSAAKRHAFIAMPFDGTLDDHFHYAIRPAARNAGLLCERLDEQSFSGDVVSRMRDRIGSATLLIADVSIANPNVYLEIGYAWGRDIPTVLIFAAGSSPVAFDLRGHRLIKYRQIRELEAKLMDELPALTGPPPRG